MHIFLRDPLKLWHEISLCGPNPFENLPKFSSSRWCLTLLDLTNRCNNGAIMIHAHYLSKDSGGRQGIHLGRSQHRRGSEGLDCGHGMMHTHSFFKQALAERQIVHTILCLFAYACHHLHCLRNQTPNRQSAIVIPVFGTNPMLKAN